MGFKLAELFVELGVKNNLGAGFALAHRQTTAAVAGLSTAANGAALSLAAMGGGAALAGLAAVTYGLYKGVQSAATLGESVSKVGVVFGDEGAKILSLADRMAAAYGTPNQVILDAATSFGLMGQAAGMANKEAAEMAVGLAKLAIDAESLMDVPLPEMLQKMRAGLAGEAEPLRTVGVFLTEAAVKAEAMRMGLSKAGKELTESQKIQARVSLIQNAPSMKKAVGDRERTKDSPKNRQREIAGRAQNTGTGIGKAVMPLWGEIVNQANRAAQAVSSFVAAAGPKIEAWATAGAGYVRTFVLGLQELLESAAAFAQSTTIQEWATTAGTALQGLGGIVGGYLMSAFDMVAMALRNFDAIIALVRVNATESFGNVLAVVDTLPENFSRITAFIGENWQTLLRDMAVGSLQAFQNLLENAFKFGKAIIYAIKGEGWTFEPKALMDGFEASTKELPKLLNPVWVDMAKERDQILEGVGANEARHAADMARRAAEMNKTTTAAATPKPGETPAAATPEKARKADFVDLAGFAKKIQEGIFGKDSGAQTAKFTELTAKGVQELVQGQKKQPPPMPVVV